jgi:ankyrin repeat protein
MMISHKINSPLGSNDLVKLVDNEQWELAIQQSNSNRHLAEAWSARPGFFEGIKSSDVLPIHIACARRPTPDVIDALYEANRMGLRQKESAYRRTPLHIACRSDASPDVVKRLLKYYPEAAAADDSLGRLPIHYRLSNGADDEIIDALLRACPGSARAFDRRGWLPLHVAASVGASPYVIQSLVEAYPDSVLLVTNKGSTPRRCLNMAPQSPHRNANTAFLQKMELEERSKLGSRKAAKPNRDSVRAVV